MSRNDWRRTDKTLDGYSLTENKTNMNKGIQGLHAEYETALVGYRGEIWEYNQNTLACVITHSQTARTFAKAIGQTTKVQKGDEALFRFPRNLLPVAVKAIKMPKSHATRARLANNFGMPKNTPSEGSNQ